MAGTEEMQELEIAGPGRTRRVLGWLGYLLLFGGIGAVFVILFYNFTGSWRLALGLVTVMITYMVLQARFAEKNLDNGR